VEIIGKLTQNSKVVAARVAIQAEPGGNRARSQLKRKNIGNYIINITTCFWQEG
jgi:hypothetical protein